jgi:hypothetical protein
MIKKLLLTAALLAPGLAHAGTPSAILTGQIVPPGQDPTVPAPPTAAQVAGFTVCVVCTDFTASSGGVWFNGAAVSGANASQTNTWLDCAGASSPVWFRSSDFPTIGPCPDITNDPGGHQALRMEILDGSTGGVNQLNPWNGSTQGSNMPTNLYIETVTWIPTFPDTRGTAHYWTGQGVGGSAPYWNRLEFDSFELGPGPTNVASMISAFHNWNLTTCPSSCGGPANWQGTQPPHASGYNSTSGYHTIGMRLTSDGNTIYKCMWIDGTFQNCVNMAVGSWGIEAWQLSDSYRQALYVVPVADSNTSTGTIISYLQHVYVWSCSNWQTTACRTANPDPGGY